MIARLMTALAAAAGLVAVQTAAGQDDGDAARGCASIADNAARLECYDRALGDDGSGDDGAAGNAEREPADRRDADDEPTVRSDGAPSERSERAEGASAAGEPGTGRVTVVDIIHRRPSEAVFVTESGGVWVQTDARRFFEPETPFTAEIRSGALGSHFLVPGGGRAIRVRPQ